MEEYFVDASGENLEVRVLISSLSELEVVRTHNAGDSFYSRNGVNQPRIPDGVYHDSNVVFKSEHENLLDLLVYLERKVDCFKQVNVEELVIWGNLSRSSQINGELSAKEIEKMARVGAAYCWSVILEDAEGKDRAEDWIAADLAAHASEWTPAARRSRQACVVSRCPER